MSKSDQKRNEALEELLSEALAAHRRCDYADAIATYTQLISYRPVPGLFSQRGIAYMDLGENRRAVQDFDEAIRLSPDVADFYVNRGNANFRMKDFDAAILDYNMAIELDPDSSVAFNGRGYAKYKLGNRDAAKDDLWKAFSLNRLYCSPVYNLALIAFEMADLNTALDYARIADRLAPNDSEVRNLLRDIMEKLEAGN